MISKLYFDQELQNHYSVKNADSSLDNMNRLNILIGANNSGKSRFLRTLFSERNFKIELTQFAVNEISQVFELMLSAITEKFNQLGYEDVSSQNISGVRLTLAQKIEELKQINFQNINKVTQDIFTYWSWLKNFNANGASHKQHVISLSGGLDRPNDAVLEIIKKFEPLIKDFIKENFNYIPERVYIPILRGLRPTQFHDDTKFDEIQDNYSKRTIRDYFQNTSVKSEEIFTGLRLYDDVKKMLLGKRDERNKIRKFETFLSKTFFSNEIVTLIPNIEDDSLHVSIGVEERAIYKLGDGIQSIIILLYPLFFNQGKNMLVFIEEPENSMHPGLQRLFIETLMLEMFSSFQYFITTHSNHFLDITLDITQTSIFTFKRMQKDSTEDVIYEIENSSNEDENILDLIGARNSSVFLSNCTIWVEGITDRLYLKRYLEVYQNYIQAQDGKSKFREDFHFSFIEYGGSNITHWAFEDEAAWEKIRANKISSKIFLIADKDSTASKPNSEKANRLIFLHEILGDRFQVTNGREIENLLKPTILIKAIRDLEKNNSSNLDFNEGDILKADYLDKPLGNFIQSSFKNAKRKYNAESGTIYCKLDFCRAATNNIKTYEDLSQGALDLVIKIYNFIASSNQ